MCFSFSTSELASLTDPDENMEAPLTAQIVDANQRPTGELLSSNAFFREFSLDLFLSTTK